MDCTFEDKVMSLKDGELAGGEAEEVRKHLAGCASCRAFLKALEQADEALADPMTDLGPSEARFREMLELAKVEGPKLARARARRRTVGVLVAVAAVVLLVGVPVAIYVTRGEQPGEERPISPAARRELWDEDVVARMVSEVGLDAGQRAEVERIAKESRGRFAEVRGEAGEVEKLRVSVRERMKGALREEQRGAFERFLRAVDFGD